MAEKKEIAILKKAIELGYVNQNQISVASSEEKTSDSKTTIDILVEKKNITHQQIKEIIEKNPNFSTSMLHSKICDGKTLFNRYEIISELGRGGMGIVYKVKDLHLQRIVALKMLLQTSTDEISIKRFLREIQTCAKLKNQYLIEIYDSNVENNKYFFTMQCIEGLSLKEYVQQNRLSRKQIIDIMTKICDGIHYAHSKGIVHRDLKPANIMIDKNKNPIIMDFGLACWDNENTNLSKNGAIIGTLLYMSPEQVSGKKRDIDARSDIYSLGAILYELLTERPPFQGSYFSILHDVLNRNPIPPREVKPDILKSLEIICLKAMAKKKEHRYQDTQKMAKDFSKIKSGKNLSSNNFTQFQNKYKHLFSMICKALIMLLFAYLAYLLGHSFSIHEKKENKFPQNITKEIWNACWKKNYFDFTSPAWEKLKATKQIKYRSIYQKWYAQKINKKYLQYFNIDKFKIAMILIPPGKFKMGELFSKMPYDKQHNVTLLQPFYITKNQITHAQYIKIISQKKKSQKSVLVSWQKAEDFCALVGMKLPTEAQWEYSQGITNSKNSNSKNPWSIDNLYPKINEWCADHQMELRYDGKKHSFTPETYIDAIEPLSLEGPWHISRNKFIFYKRWHSSSLNSFRCLLPIYIGSDNIQKKQHRKKKLLGSLVVKKNKLQTTKNIKIIEKPFYIKQYKRFAMFAQTRLVFQFELPKKIKNIIMEFNYQVPNANKVSSYIGIKINGKIIEDNLELKFRGYGGHGRGKKHWLLPKILNQGINTISMYQSQPSANIWFYGLNIIKYGEKN